MAIWNSPQESERSLSIIGQFEHEEAVRLGKTIPRLDLVAEDRVPPPHLREWTMADQLMKELYGPSQADRAYTATVEAHKKRKRDEQIEEYESENRLIKRLREARERDKQAVANEVGASTSASAKDKPTVKVEPKSSRVPAKAGAGSSTRQRARKSNNSSTTASAGGRAKSPHALPTRRSTRVRNRK